MSAIQLLASFLKLNGCYLRPKQLLACPSTQPLPDASYLAVNSSNVSSACASLHLTADWEKARWAVQATGVERYTGARTATRLIFEVARTKDMLRLNWPGRSFRGGCRRW